MPTAAPVRDTRVLIGYLQCRQIAHARTGSRTSFKSKVETLTYVRFKSPTWSSPLEYPSLAAASWSRPPYSEILVAHASTSIVSDGNICFCTIVAWLGLSLSVLVHVSLMLPGKHPWIGTMPWQNPNAHIFHWQHPQRNSEPRLFRKALNRSGWQILGLRFSNLLGGKPTKYWTQCHFPAEALDCVPILPQKRHPRWSWQGSSWCSSRVSNDLCVERQHASTVET